MKLTASNLRAQDMESITGELRADISGGIAQPADASYDAARKVWNGAVTNRPAVIALCQNTADVQAAVRTARHHNLPLSVRGGGHDWAGRALRHNGLVIDLTGMRQVEVDPHTRITTVGGGALVKDLAAAADTHGLVAALGNCGAVGLAGLTLGGGYGPFIGTQGLTVDNLLSAEVVLADGRCVTADAQHEPELFWALRGGRGNFGAVTSLRIQLHEKRHMLGGAILYPWSEAEKVLLGYAACEATMPDELGMVLGMASGPDGEPVVMFWPLWNGDEQQGAPAIDRLRALGQPQLAQIGPMAYGEVLAQADASLDERGHCHWESQTRSLPALAPGAINALTSAISRRTSSESLILIHPFHGAATRVAPDATAFGLRDHHFMVEIHAAWDPDKDDGSIHRQWARDVSRDLNPFSVPGGYANILGPDDRERARHAYGANGDRLKALKRRYDPDDVFASAISLPD